MFFLLQGSRSVVGIYFNFSGSKEKINISERAFEGMSNLQFLKLFGAPNTLDLPGGLDYLSRKLRLLHWIHFPMTCLPSIVNFEFLVELIMCRSKLEKLWDGIKVINFYLFVLEFFILFRNYSFSFVQFLAREKECSLSFPYLFELNSIRMEMCFFMFSFSGFSDVFTNNCVNVFLLFVCTAAS